MSAQIKKIIDSSGNTIAPRTTIGAITTNDGTQTLQSILDNKALLEHTHTLDEIVDFDAENFKGDKGDTGDSGVFVGNEEPEDENKNVWIDPTETFDFDFNQKVDKLFATNLVTNGDFSNGTTGWTSAGSTNTVIANTLINTANGTTQFPRVDGGNIFANNQTYYVRARARVTSNLSNDLNISNGTNIIARTLTPIQNQWYQLTGVVVNPPSTQLRIYHTYSSNANANGAVMEVQYVSVINLTQTFGAGNEPTKAQMDYLLANFPNSWFNGTVELTNYRQLLDKVSELYTEKANRIQEAWITPTLLNGATQVSEFRPVRFYKDEFGIVRLKGAINITSLATTVFQLPVGYRPLNIGRYAVSTNTGFGYIEISGVGNVTVGAGALTNIFIDGITFRVEQ